MIEEIFNFVVVVVVAIDFLSLSRHINLQRRLQPR